MNLKEALESLDPGNDEHWTQDGAPLLEVLSEMVGDKVSRGQVTKNYPQFTRENPVIESEEVEDESTEEESAEPEESEAPELGKEAQAVEKATRKRDKMVEKVEEARAKLTEAQEELDEACKKYDEANPKPTLNDEIRRFIDAQDQMRAERVARTKSALDEAMGTRRPRPNYPKR